MRVLYIAKHGSGGNQDEDAISYALEKLGHTVYRIPEESGRQECRKYRDATMCLYHKWDDVLSLKWLKGRMLRVCYYFDLVEFPDPELEGRNRTRREWMERVLAHTDLAFCTDGDWVLKQNRYDIAAKNKPKTHWLMQGCDERIALPSKRTHLKHDILFTGISKRGGVERERFVQEMNAVYGNRFHHVQSGVHGRDLADLIAGSKIVVAPNSPVTNQYWSNRVYLSLGFGACLLHPLCDRLMDHYEMDKEITYYEGMNDLHTKIESLLSSPQRRDLLSRNGWERSIGEHTYRHRVEKMLSIIKEKM